MIVLRLLYTAAVMVVVLWLLRTGNPVGGLVLVPLRRYGCVGRLSLDGSRGVFVGRCGIGWGACEPSPGRRAEQRRSGLWCPGISTAACRPAGTRRPLSVSSSAIAGRPERLAGVQRSGEQSHRPVAHRVLRCRRWRRASSGVAVSTD